MLVISSSVSADITDGLIGYWPLDEGAGTTTADMSPAEYGFDGTLVGGPAWTGGQFGSALSFDGADDYVLCIERDGTGPGTYPEELMPETFAVSCWTKLNNFAYFSSFVGNGMDTGSDECGFFLYNYGWQNTDVGREFGLAIRTEAGMYYVDTPSVYNTDTWYHLAATYDGAEANIYVDGQLPAGAYNPMNVGGPMRWISSESGNYPERFTIGVWLDPGYELWIDGIIDDIGYWGRALTADEISTIYSMGEPLIPPPNPVLAGDPVPPDKAKDVARDVVLRWTPGDYAPSVNGHKVYLSDSFDDVINGAAGADRGLTSNPEFGTANLPFVLDFDTTYYWRIDEANSTTGWDEGNVWQFTVEPLANPIDGNNITVTASSLYAADQGPEKTINGSGLDANDLHSTEETDMWLSGGEPNAWIEYELDKVQKLHQMWVWNSNQTMESFLGLGFKDVTIDYSTNGTDYTTLAGVPEFAQAPGASDYAYNTEVDFNGVAAKYVRLTANSKWGVFMPQSGLSEVRFFSIPVHAREPGPDSGATDVDVEATLSWKAGRDADTHDVYLSSNEQAVIDGNVPVTNVAETNYGPLSLDLGTTYYWKINEVNEATTTTWQGEIWNFTTQEYLVVDDFESYNEILDAEEGSNLVYLTWIDGYDNPLVNGSTMGHTVPFEPSMESVTVYGGSQSAPLYYDNTTAGYSEATRTFAVPQDWTKAGVQTLALHFHGTAGNTGQLYVEVNGSKVVYPGDAGNLARAGWQAWNIELALFDTNLQGVTTLAIGIDDNGASGTLYFDDIRLYARSPEFITPVEPSSDGLIGHWKFDSDTRDSSGLGNHGTANGNSTFVAGKVGSNALELDGNDYVVIDGVADDITNNDITLAAWVNMTADDAWYPIISCNTAGGDNVGWLAVDYGYVDFDPFTGTTFVTDNDWHHLAYTRLGDSGSLYVDGVLDGTHTPNFNFSADNLWSIGQEWDGGPSTSDFLIGTVDDARIYDYALSHAEIAWLAGRTEPFDEPF